MDEADSPIETLLLSEAVKAKNRDWVLAYAILCARHADADSEFEKLLRPYRQRSDAELLTLLLYTGYDGFIIARNRQVLGHVWYQRRNDELRVFSVWIARDYRRQLREMAILGMIERAQRQTGIAKIRWGTEMHAKSVSWILDWLQRKHGDIGIVKHENGVVFFR